MPKPCSKIAFLWGHEALIPCESLPQGGDEGFGIKDPQDLDPIPSPLNRAIWYLLIKRETLAIEKSTSQLSPTS